MSLTDSITEGWKKIFKPDREPASVVAEERVDVALRTTPARTPPPPSDPRLSRARKGVSGKYRVHPSPSEKVLFNVYNFNDEGRTVKRVFPVSYYKDGKCVARTPQVKGRALFLPAVVLFGKCDVERLPLRYREVLGPWALGINVAAQVYDANRKETRKKRSRA